MTGLPHARADALTEDASYLTPVSNLSREISEGFKRLVAKV
jgi:hypothetical protein